MKSTSPTRSTLERRHSPAPAHPRFAERAMRHALFDVIRDPAADSGQRTPPATYWRWHELTRKDPRSPLPCADERTMLHDAIRAGCTTRDKVLRYFLARIADAMAQFPDAADFATSDILYVHAMAEIAEAQEAAALAHTMPSEATRTVAAREGREAHAVLELLCTTYERGASLPFPEAG